MHQAEHTTELKIKRETQHLCFSLDWYPNPVHAGFFVALEKGYFKRLKLSITFTSPATSDEGAHDILLNKESDLAICPPEFLIKSLEPGQASVVGVAALLQGCVSAFGIHEHKQNKKTIYTPLGLPYELSIVKKIYQEVVHELQLAEPNRAKMYQHFYEHKSELVWLFKPIEAVEASEKNIPYHLIELSEKKIPYPQHPFILVRKETLEEKKEAIDRFLLGMQTGYAFAASNLDETFEIIESHMSPFYDRKILKKMLKACIPYFLNQNLEWGTIDHNRLWDFYVWLRKDAANLPVIDRKLFSNQLIKQ